MTTKEETKEEEMAETKLTNIVFAEDETTIHIALGEPTKIDGQVFYPVESKTLLPGDYIEIEKLPKYLQDNIKAEKTPTLSLVTLEEAIVKRQERERILAMLGSQIANNTHRTPAPDEV